MLARKCTTKAVIIEVDDEETKGRISICEEEELPALGPSSVLVQVKACSLTSAVTEQENRELLKGVCTSKTSSGKVRLCVGQDIAGVVKAVGSDVSTLNVGDSVVGKSLAGPSSAAPSHWRQPQSIIPLDYNQSGCASYVVVQEFDVAVKPDNVNFTEAAACIGDALKSYTALHYLGRLSSGDSVLVLGGASPAGSLCIQLARHWGAKVLAVVGPAPVEKQHLISLNLDHSQILEAGPNMKSQLMLETGTLGADLIIDPLGSKSVGSVDVKVHDIISCLAVGGRWISSKSDLQLDPPNSRQLLLRCASVGFLYEQAWMLSSAQQGRYQHILMDVMEKIALKVIKPHILQTVTGLDSVPEALQALEEMPPMGKIVVSLS